VSDPDPSGTLGEHPGEGLDLAAQRESYTAGELLESQVHGHPLGQFERWFRDTRAAGPNRVPEPNAMVIATADAGGAPSSRTVLLKGVDARGFVFYTNYASRKATQLGANPAAALTFPWYGLHRQVGVRGVAERVPREESAAYFVTRPWASRIGAWASRQSSPVAARTELDDAWAAAAARWPDRGTAQDVPLPEFWGGFVVRPVEVEFWQGRIGRLHDRLVYVARGGAPGRLDAPDDWRVERRQP
jgi:pyridoxamine 5'-phosphate oxidase